TSTCDGARSSSATWRRFLSRSAATARRARRAMAAIAAMGDDQCIPRGPRTTAAVACMREEQCDDRRRMRPITDYPAFVLLLTLALLWPSALLGAFVLRRERAIPDDVDKHYGLILGATLTLLSLIVGFSFSMAVGRYDQRKNFEEEEANAIGTEYVRADLLPAPSTANVRSLLSRYLAQRILFYATRDTGELAQVNDATARLQSELWSAVRAPASAQPSPVLALAVSGMNDVLNSQGYTQAAWRNRIPIEGWALMVFIA